MFAFNGHYKEKKYRRKEKVDDNVITVNFRNTLKKQTRLILTEFAYIVLALKTRYLPIVPEKALAILTLRQILLSMQKPLHSLRQH